MSNNPFEKANEKKRITELLKERDELRLEVKLLKLDLSEERMRASLFQSSVEYRERQLSEYMRKNRMLKRRLHKITKR